MPFHRKMPSESTGQILSAVWAAIYIVGYKNKSTAVRFKGCNNSPAAPGYFLLSSKTNSSAIFLSLYF